jgi:hypothetical protein
MTPDDATAAALRRYVAEGSDLTRPMRMDFFVAVPTKEAGDEVASQVMALGFASSVEQSQETGTWTCYCTKTIIPQYATVVQIEAELDGIGRKVGGYADGFGSFGNAPGPSK